MAKRSDILAGATDQTVDVWIQDSASTTGGGKTGLAYNTASLVCYYRKGATGSATALTLATQTVGGAHSDGGFVEIDATNMPGLYRLDLSDTIVASAGMVTVMLKGASGMAPVLLELEVQPATGKKADVVSWLGTAAATPTVAGVPEVDVTHFNGTTGTFASGRPEVNTSHIAGSAVSTSSAQIGVNVVNAGGTAWGSGAITAGSIAADAITAAKVAADVTTEIQSGLATAADLATVDSVVDAIKAKTDSLTFTQAGHVDANVQRINDVAITGDGSGTPFGV